MYQEKIEMRLKDGANNNLRHRDVMVRGKLCWLLMMRIKSNLLVTNSATQ